MINNQKVPDIEIAVSNKTEGLTEEITVLIDWLIEAYSPDFCTKRLKFGLEQ